VTLCLPSGLWPLVPCECCGGLPFDKLLRALLTVQAAPSDESWAQAEVRRLEESVAAMSIQEAMAEVCVCVCGWLVVCSACTWA
jgi:hypothetical protein